MGFIQKVHWICSMKPPGSRPLNILDDALLQFEVEKTGGFRWGLVIS
jgi:hypothetical protein